MAANPSSHPQFTQRFWERYGSDELIGIRSGLEVVLDERARQFSLFEPPSVIEIATAKAAAIATETAIDLGAVLSPSQVRKYLDCSASWWFHYGLKLPDPPNANLGLGRAFHKALEVNFREKLSTKEDLPTAEVIELFDGAWEMVADEVSFAADDNVDELQASGRVLVQKFMSEAAVRIAPAAVERQVEGEIAGVKVHGYIDLMDTAGRIIDVKTASKRPNDVDPSYGFQIATYRQLPLIPIEGENVAPRANGEATIITLVKTKTPQLIEQTYSVSLEDEMGTQKQYPLVQAGIRHGLYVPNRKSMFCSKRSCNFWRECMESYGGRVND